jgi:hydroxymethylglutaryl-CoA synthase
MSGIIAFGSYIPRYRISREVIAREWGRNSLGGERTVANNDEDVVTMAVEAARNCLATAGKSSKDIDALYFASSTAPYREKMIAVTIAEVLDMRSDIITCDHANSMRAMAGALVTGFGSVSDEFPQNILVVGADQRNAYPKSNEEQYFGDGASALLLGKSNVAALLKGSYSLRNEMMDIWRTENDKYVCTWESRFVINEGVVGTTVTAVEKSLAKFKIEAKDIAKVIFSYPNDRVYKTLAKRCGFNYETQVQDSLLTDVGYLGNPHASVMLQEAINGASPGDLLLMTAYGDGVDVFLFEVTGNSAKLQNSIDLRDMIDTKLMVPSYARFLSYKGLVESLPGEPFKLMPSATSTWRDAKTIYKCQASKCRSCGMITFPIQRVCYDCRSKDNYEVVPISHMKGKVFTYVIDNLAGRSDDPSIVQAVVTMENGCRFYGIMTDCDVKKISVGMEVVLTFRKFYEGAGFNQYFWKCKPIGVE